MCRLVVWCGLVAKIRVEFLRADEIVRGLVAQAGALSDVVENLGEVVGEHGDELGEMEGHFAFGHGAVVAVGINQAVCALGVVGPQGDDQDGATAVVSLGELGGVGDTEADIGVGKGFADTLFALGDSFAAGLAVLKVLLDGETGVEQGAAIQTFVGGGREAADFDTVVENRSDGGGAGLTRGGGRSRGDYEPVEGTQRLGVLRGLRILVVLDFGLDFG